jgi:hypothetical protein
MLGIEIFPFSKDYTLDFFFLFAVTTPLKLVGNIFGKYLNKGLIYNKTYRFIINK